jgi:hypothetical protein
MFMCVVFVWLPRFRELLIHLTLTPDDNFLSSAPIRDTPFAPMFCPEILDALEPYLKDSASALNVVSALNMPTP